MNIKTLSNSRINASNAAANTVDFLIVAAGGGGGYDVGGGGGAGGLIYVTNCDSVIPIVNDILSFAGITVS